MSVYGNLIVHIEDDITDRIGIRTAILSQLWQVVGPVPASPLDPALDAMEPPAPAVPGGLAFIGRQRRRAPGGFKTLWTFEGVSGDGNDVTFKGRNNSPDFSFEPGFSQVSIIKHPQFEALKANFNGQVLDGQVLFQEYLAGGGSNGLVVGAASGSLNPMFGVVDFFRMEGTYSFRYASLTAPSQSGVGYVSSDIPGQPPALSDGRNWLKAPVPYQHRGTIFDVTEVYWLSGAGGWPVPVYTPGGASGGGGLAAQQNAFDNSINGFQAVFGGTPGSQNFIGPTQ